MTETTPKALPLARFHEEAGAQIVPFAGFSMPMKYTSIKDEHQRVRQKVGLFDVSHMGEIEVKGKDAIALVDRIVTNDVSKLVDGQALYTVMCHEDGGIVDDLLVYRLGPDHLLLCVNAANRQKDWDHINKYATGDAELFERSDDYVQLALQGPRAVAVLSQLVDGDAASSLGYFRSQYMKVAGYPCLVSRTGYTGEDGFELYIEADYAEPIFEGLLDSGRDEDMALCGLGCRDTLRLEAKLHLYGQDITDETNPLEAGLSWVVKLNKSEDFVGKAAIEEIKANGLTRRLRGLVVQDKGVIRQGYEIFAGESSIGHVTSGSFSITLDRSIGLGYIDIDHVKDDAVEVAVRKRRLSATLTTKPFYTRP